MGHLGAILALLGVLLGPSWHTGGHLGRTWAHIGAVLQRSWGHLVAILGCLGQLLLLTLIILILTTFTLSNQDADATFEEAFLSTCPSPLLLILILE